MAKKPVSEAPLEDGLEEPVGVEVGGTQLEQEQVCIHHGVAEVALDVRHGLALDLQAVARPQPAHHLVERHLSSERRETARPI